MRYLKEPATRRDLLWASAVLALLIVLVIAAAVRVAIQLHERYDVVVRENRVVVEKAGEQEERLADTEAELDSVYEQVDRLEAAPAPVVRRVAAPARDTPTPAARDRDRAQLPARPVRPVRAPAGPLERPALPEPPERPERRERPARPERPRRPAPAPAPVPPAATPAPPTVTPMPPIIAPPIVEPPRPGNKPPHAPCPERNPNCP